MLSKVLKFLHKNIYISRLITSSGLLLKNEKNYLYHIGWFRSRHAGLPVDNDGKPLPWYTYSAISFLNERINKNMSVFEYGSGNSTLWWSSRVKKVTACEHDLEWYNLIKPSVPPNVVYLFHELETGGDYSKEISKYKNEFDIIVIDGRDRINCTLNSFEALTGDGVIVFDNSDRGQYNEAYAALATAGFKRIDFAGMGPIGKYGWKTSVFYRPSNCLNI